jgi:hypothetical protein
MATITAFVDGELDAITAARVARDAETDPELAAVIARERTLRAELSAHFAPVLDEAVPDRFAALLAGAAKVDTSLAARRAAKQEGSARRFAPMQWGTLGGAMAASLLLGLAVGMQPWRADAPVKLDGGALIAAGPLAEALDSQLASAPAADDDVRIGLTFRDRTGRWCRTFASAGLDGIGCRSGDDWRLERTQPGSAAPQYRQASSAELAAAAAAMMAGDAADAAAEAAARDGGWTSK